MILEFIFTTRGEYIRVGSTPAFMLAVAVKINSKSMSQKIVGQPRLRGYSFSALLNKKRRIFRKPILISD